MKEFYYASKKTEFYAGLLSSGRVSFMAYKEAFLSEYPEYIVSPREICFHVAFMASSIIGFIISLKAFPSFYPGTKA